MRNHSAKQKGQSLKRTVACGAPVLRRIRARHVEDAPGWAVSLLKMAERRSASELLQCGDYSGCELGGRGGAAHIAGERFAFAIDSMQRIFNAPRRIHFADVI